MVQVLKGNIVQAPALGELQITEQGYLVSGGRASSGASMTGCHWNMLRPRWWITVRHW